MAQDSLPFIRIRGGNLSDCAAYIKIINIPAQPVFGNCTVSLELVIASFECFYP